MLANLVPGGISGALRTSRAATMLASVRPVDAVVAERKRQARDLLGDVRRLDADITATKVRIVSAVATSKTSLTDIYGVGPIVAVLVIGHAGPVGRFASRHQFASYNGSAPIEASSGPKKRHRLTPAATASSTTRCTSRPSVRSASTRPGGRTTCARLKRARRRRRPSAPSSGGSPTPCTASSGSTRPDPRAERAREDNQGRLFSGVTGLHPDHRRFGQVTPGPSTTLRNATSLASARRNGPLDTKRLRYRHV